MTRERALIKNPPCQQLGNGLPAVRNKGFLKPFGLWHSLWQPELTDTPVLCDKIIFSNNHEIKQTLSRKEMQNAQFFT